MARGGSRPRRVASVLHYPTRPPKRRISLAVAADAALALPVRNGVEAAYRHTAPFGETPVHGRPGGVPRGSSEAAAGLAWGTLRCLSGVPSVHGGAGGGSAPSIPEHPARLPFSATLDTCLRFGKHHTLGGITEWRDS